VTRIQPGKILQRIIERDQIDTARGSGRPRFVELDLLPFTASLLCAVSSSSAKIIGGIRVLFALFIDREALLLAATVRSGCS